MENYQCQYLNHENEEIIGFCLNQNCQFATQFCYQCTNTTHSQHFNDCIRFSKLIQFMDQFKQISNHSKQQFIEISQKYQKFFQQILKKVDEEIEKLEKMAQQLQNQDYFNFKSQINIIKQFYSKENDNYTQKQITQLNNILDTMKNMVSDQNKIDDQYPSVEKNPIKITEITQNTKVENPMNIEDIDRIIKQGDALNNINEYEEAIKYYDKAISIYPENDNAWNNKGSALQNLNKNEEALMCYEIAISINPNYDNAWYNKGLALQNLNKNEEAIQCYDKAISINPNYDYSWNNKGNALQNLNKNEEAIKYYDKAISINPKNDNALINKGLALSNLNQHYEAIQCYDKAISINPKNDNAWSNKGFSLIQLKRYKDAIDCYDKALSICINPSRLKRKADSLLELGKKEEAKQVYMAALKLGSNEKDFIQKQLSKL
ncbi:unnamed protein product [Paramecium primaurelia]|uniref:Tetratricopeptide repeat protein n=1 Tax=Paramecium primaurelia TaxID=5886 RepID=A0A8S1QGM2_PARPR|nr:unnamed protein product [Paramecium primaurelia]